MKHTQGEVTHGSGLPETGGTSSVNAPFGKGWPFTKIMQGYETIAILPAQDKNKIVGRNPEPDVVTTDYNARRIEAFWNAADGMTTEEAVRYIKHGREMVGILKMLSSKHCMSCYEISKCSKNK